MKLIKLTEYNEHTHNAKYVINDYGNIEYVTHNINFNEVEEVRNCGNEGSYLYFKDSLKKAVNVTETVEDIEELLIENNIDYTITLDEGEEDSEFYDNNFSIQLLD